MYTKQNTCISIIAVWIISIALSPITAVFSETFEPNFRNCMMFSDIKNLYLSILMPAIVLLPATLIPPYCYVRIICHLNKSEKRLRHRRKKQNELPQMETAIVATFRVMLSNLSATASAVVIPKADIVKTIEQPIRKISSSLLSMQKNQKVQNSLTVHLLQDNDNQCVCNIFSQTETKFSNEITVHQETSFTEKKTVHKDTTSVTQKTTVHHHRQSTCINSDTRPIKKTNHSLRKSIGVNSKRRPRHRNDRKRRNKKIRKVTVNVTIIWVVFVICWYPVSIYRFLDYMNSIQSHKTFECLAMFAYSYSAINMILYAGMNRNFRKAFMLIFYCACKCYKRKP